MSAPPFRKVILLVDGTEAAVKAAEFAIQMARVLPLQLVALAVVDTATLRKLMSVHILVEQEVSEFESELERSHQRQLDQVFQMAKKAGVALETVLQKGIAHSVTLAEQKARHADLIVMGGFRSTITKHDLIARERQLILDEAPCTVMVVK
jgi:nucleotide-binding universal stress UspA family protein